MVFKLLVCFTQAIIEVFQNPFSMHLILALCEFRESMFHR